MDRLDNACNPNFTLCARRFRRKCIRGVSHRRGIPGTRKNEQSRSSQRELESLHGAVSEIRRRNSQKGLAVFQTSYSNNAVRNASPKTSPVNSSFVVYS